MNRPATTLELVLAAYLLLQTPYLAYRRAGFRLAIAALLLGPLLGGLSGLVRPFVPHDPLGLVAIGLAAASGALLVLPRQRLEDAARALGGRPAKVAIATLLTLAPFGLAENGVRALVVRGSLRLPSPLVVVMAKGSEDWRAAHMLLHREQRPDPALFWRVVPAPPYNRQGFGGPPVAVPKPEGVFRVIAYGDSNTDLIARPTWPEKLRELLEARPARTRFEVLNAGVAGYSSYQGLTRFRQEVDRYTPDLVFVSFGWNDLPPAIRAPDKHFRPGMASIAVQRLLLRYQAFLVLRNRLTRSAPPATGTARVPPDDYAANLRAFVEEGRRRGVTVVLLTRPHEASSAEQAKARGWRGLVPAYNRIVLEVAEQTGAVALDVQREMDDHAEFVDECHLTEQGHRHMARFLVDELVRRKILPE